MQQEASIRSAIITVSDSRSAGERRDETTVLLAGVLERAGLVVADTVLVPDEADAIAAAIVRLADEERVGLVVTTGGTGLGPRDVTPEATRAVLDREVPGIGEAFRAVGAAKTPFAWLSRGIAGVRGATLVANLPGSPRGAAECLEVLVPLVAHALEVVGGAGHDAATEPGASDVGARDAAAGRQ